MGLRVILDFTNAVDDETGEHITRSDLEGIFSPDDEDNAEMIRLGVTMTIEEY